MGVLGLTTPELVRDSTNLPEVANMGNSQLQAYIDRAESIIDRGNVYDTTKSGYASQMRLAVNMLVENMIVIETPSWRRSRLSGFRSESIGNYSYSRDKSVATTAELALSDEIIGILRNYGTDKLFRNTHTEVFIPRTYKTDPKGDITYYVSEDEIPARVAIPDPKDPRVP